MVTVSFFFIFNLHLKITSERLSVGDSTAPSAYTTLPEASMILIIMYTSVIINYINSTIHIHL